MQPDQILESRTVYVDDMGIPVAGWNLIQDEDDEIEVAHWKPWAFDDDEEIYTPFFLPLPGSQVLFLECPIFEALYHGNRGPGKTLTLIMDFAKEVGRGFGKSWRGILFRRHFKDLDDVVKKIEEFFPEMWPGFRFLKSKSEYMAIWPTGEALLIRHIEKESDYDSYHGHEYPWIGWEELTQWADDKVFNLMQSCCRSSAPGIPCRVRSTTNPHGIGHNWVKKRYELPHKDGKVIRIPGQMPRVAIRGALRENFLLLQNQPQYEIIIANAAKNPEQARAWIEGAWDITSGGMVDDLWNNKVHVIPNIPAGSIPRSWTLTRAYDHGQSHPFSVGWWLESSGEPIVIDGVTIGNVRGDLILWMEWYGTTGEPNVGVRMRATKIAEGILDREEDENVLGRVTDGPADTEIYTNVATGTGRGPADDMEDMGVTWERADKSRGSRKRGWEKLRELLEQALPGKDGTRDRPGLFICTKCKYWLDLVPVMPRDETDPDEIPSTYEDHCLHPDTKILTKKGNIRILDLIGEVGNIMTIDGWERFEGVRKTRSNTDIVEVFLSDGSSFKCTPDHEILMADGSMIQAVDTIGLECYHTSSCQKKSQSSIGQNKNFSERDITYAESTSKRKEDDSIGLFGSFIMGPYQKGVRFITSTIIDPIIKLKILKQYQVVGIDPIMENSSLIGSKKIMQKPLKKLRNGTNQMKVKTGTKITTREMSKIKSLSEAQLRVNSVVSNSQDVQESVSFVHQDVNQRGEDKVALTILKKYVKNVMRFLGITNTANQDSVVKVVQVVSAGKSDVYCMTVPSSGHFTLSNGIVVSNCADMTRYRITWSLMGMFRKSF